MSAAEGTRPRLRYAPSPTGDPHVGNIRTALWSWLHARRHGGAFIVRIEDTDQARAVPGAEERILESLRWLGIDWDEGPGVDGPHAPYVQSQRLPLYREAVDRLLAAGSAYRCFDTPEQLAAMREEQRARKVSPGYDGRCRAIPPPRPRRAPRVANRSWCASACPMTAAPPSTTRSAARSAWRTPRSMTS